MGDVMTKRNSIPWLAALGLWCSALAAATPALAESRGELLYSTHCIACHTTQMHWRDKSVINDWNALLAMVRRWQSNTGLSWNDADIGEVARYLNETFYHVVQAPGPVATQVPTVPQRHLAQNLTAD
jgi:mono/diheme cytochrome c family protein